MNTQVKNIRPSSRFWQQDIGAIALLGIIFPIVAILYYGVEMYLAGGFGLVIGSTYLITEIRKALGQEITFTKSEIIVKIGKEVFKQPWESIKAVKFMGPGQSRLLVLYFDDHFLKIPSRFYDKAELTDRLREHVSPSVLHPQAYQRTPWFLDWQENVIKKISAVNRPLKVSLGGFEKWLGIFCISVGILSAVLYHFSKVELIDALFLGGLFGGLGLLLLLTCIGWLEADNSRISVRSLFKKYTFFWIDLREIYINTNQGVIALVGDNSRLIVPKFSSWSGKDKEMLHELINYKIEMSKIELMESSKPVFWMSKNS